VKLGRSFLFVPGDRPEMLAKTAARGADVAVADLEDAVPADRKETARLAVQLWLDTPPSRTRRLVRVNNHSDLLEGDLAAATRADGIVFPKAEAEGLLADINRPTVALLETAHGWGTAGDIAQLPHVLRLACGEADLCSELGIDPSPDERELLPFRMEVVRASVAAGLSPPIGPVVRAIRDQEELRVTSEALRRMGFGGRLAIHPAQVEGINAAFTPQPEEVALARRLLDGAAASGKGVFVDEEGRMVDEAVLRGARRVLELADGLAANGDAR
jgi:citrate lyase subunit beta/citryl-CoA lyase